MKFLPKRVGTLWVCGSRNAETFTTRISLESSAEGLCQHEKYDVWWLSGLCLFNAVHRRVGKGNQFFNWQIEYSCGLVSKRSVFADASLPLCEDSRSSLWNCSGFEKWFSQEFFHLFQILLKEKNFFLFETLFDKKKAISIMWAAWQGTALIMKAHQNRRNHGYNRRKCKEIHLTERAILWSDQCCGIRRQKSIETRESDTIGYGRIYDTVQKTSSQDQRYAQKMCDPIWREELLHSDRTRKHILCGFTLAFKGIAL